MLGEVLTAIVTPFTREGTVDIGRFRALARYLVDRGSDGVVVAGTTGECPTLTDEERAALIAAALEEIGDRATVIAGTGTYSTAHSVHLTKAAHALGVHGVLVVTPYYNKPPQEGLYRHFATLAAATPLPCILYNIPGRTGSNILPETIANLAKLPTIVAVKEATGSMDQASAIAALCDITLLSGDDSLTLPLMSIGGRGVVSVVGNVVPRDMKALVAAWDAGKRDEAIRLHYKLFTLCRDMLGISTNPIPVKTALRMLGRDTGELRLPLCTMDASQEAKLAQTLKAYGLM